MTLCLSFEVLGAGVSTCDILHHGAPLLDVQIDDATATTSCEWLCLRFNQEL